MIKKSAGILLYRFNNNELEVFVVHPGGPFFKNKDLGVWSIPKGEIEETEEPLAAAIREFKEEIGKDITGDFIPLRPITQKSGKTVYAWALEWDLNPAELTCNDFKMEWPPRSGKFQSFPEVDKGEWFNTKEVKEKMIQAQTTFVDELLSILNK